MQKNQAKSGGEKTSLLKKIPGWAFWLAGYVLTLALSAGLVYYWRVVYFLDGLPALPATLAVMGVFSLLYLAVFLLCRMRPEKICLKATLCIFLLGLLFVFATAPLQAPDETKYYLRANSISRGVFTYNYVEDYPNDVDLLVENFFPEGRMPLNHRVQYQGDEMAPAAFADYRDAINSGSAAEAPASEPLIFMLLPFLPQGLFIAAARLFGFTALGQLYAARIANLLLYSVLCYFTFKNARRYRGVFFAFALLPVSLFMGASCSYDGVALALCYFAASVLFRDEIRWRHLVCFGLAVMVANYIKPLNFLLAFLILLVPKGRWKLGNIKKKWPVRPWMALLGCLLLVFAFRWVMEPIDRHVLGGSWPSFDELPRGSGENPDIGGQIAFVLRNPARFIATALLSLYEADGFLFDLGRLGHMDLVLPLVSGLSVLGLGAGVVLSVRQKNDARRGTALVLLGIGLVYAAAVLGSMYLYDTDYASIRVTGQQPRYFLPAFMLMALALSMALGRLQRPRLDTQEAAIKAESVVLWVCAAIALVGAVLLFQNYFVGQWIPKAEGGWKLVNLYGWVPT